MNLRAMLIRWWKPRLVKQNGKDPIIESYRLRLDAALEQLKRDAERPSKETE